MARHHAKANPRIDEKVWQQLETLIREEWSPEQIVGRFEDKQGACISHEWIYRYIYADKRSGGDLYRCLHCQKPRRKRYGSYDRRGIIPNQVSINERLAIVDNKRRFGNWCCSLASLSVCLCWKSTSGRYLLSSVPPAL